MTFDIEELGDPPQKPDFRRANGAPMVMIDGKNARLSRPSGWGKVLDDENALVNWKLDRAIEGVAKDPALQARVAAVKPDDRAAFKELRELAINTGRGDQAADIGTALHAMSERWEDDNDEFDPPEQYAKTLRAYTAEMEKIGLRSVLFEFQIVNEHFGAAGTVDRLYEAGKPIMTPDGEIHPPGTLFIGDLKTGKKLDFSLPGYCVQTAIYAGGRRYDVIDDEFMATPEWNRDWGLVVHMPADQEFCEFVWVDLGVGNYGAEMVAQVRRWRKQWRGKEPYGAYQFNYVDPLFAEAEVIDELPALIDWCKQRMQEIAKHGDAKKRLGVKWDLPKPADIKTAEEVDRWVELLDVIEAEFGLTFPAGDPRIKQGVHMDEMKEKAE